MRFRVTCVLAAVITGTACELTEVTVADVEDAVIAEIILFAGPGPQRALLHRARGVAADARVPGAQIEVRDVMGRTLRFLPAAVTDCVDFPDDADTAVGSCYASAATGAFEVAPGATYTLRIVLADGGVLTGTTTLPSAFSMTAPASAACAIPPDTTVTLQWTSAANTWAYIAETSIAGIRAALAQRGVSIRKDPLRLFGLAVSREDTTIVFPTEFGLFDRADTDVADALLAMRRGLPPAVTATVVVGATERNYVNWARGGQFNPSGIVRVPSVRGDGTGVFAGIVAREIRMTTSAGSALPGCLR